MTRVAPPRLPSRSRLGTEKGEDEVPTKSSVRSVTSAGDAASGGIDVQKFWRWLGLNLGKHWIIVLVGRRAGHRRARLRHHEPEVLDRPGQLPQQERPGLQGQRRLPEALRRRGDGRARHDGQGPHRQRAVHPRRTSRSGHASSKQLHDSGKVVNVVTPLTALQFNDALVRSPAGDPTQSVAGKILLGASRPRPVAGRTGRSATPTRPRR